MADLKCNACYGAFDEQELHQIPRILFCGHTFCSKCIQNLLESTKTCPQCKHEMPEKSCEEFPINYYVLEIKGTVDISSSNLDDVSGMYSRNARSLLNEYSNLKTVMEGQKKKNDKLLGLVENGEKKLESLIKEDVLFSSNSRDVVKSLKTQLLNIRSKIVPHCSIPSNDGSVAIGLWSKDFDSIDSYLSEINKGISSNKRYAAVLKFGDITKYAKLSIYEDFLLIHSFEKKTQDSQLFTVCYKDLLSSLLNNQVGITKLISPSNMSLPVYGFLDFPVGSICRPQRIFIEVYKSYFLGLCTGERGYSYKGGDCECNSFSDSRNVKGERKRLLRVNMPNVEQRQGEKMVESVSKYVAVLEKQSVHHANFKYCFLLDATDSFEIIQVNPIYNSYTEGYEYSPGIVGVVVNHQLLSTFENGTKMVLDSGIAIKMVAK